MFTDEPLDDAIQINFESLGAGKARFTIWHAGMLLVSLAVFLQCFVGSMRSAYIISKLRAGEERLAARSFDASISALKQAVRVDPACRQTHRLIAQCYLGQHKFESAVNELKLCTIGQFVDSEPWIELGGCLTKLNRLPEAEIAYRTACAISPHNDVARVRLGQCVAASGQLNPAIDILRYALQINPKSVEAHTGLGVLVLAQGSYDEAIAHLTRAVKLNPRSLAAHNALGTAYASHGDYDLAIGEFRIEIALEPQFAAGYFNLASALEKAKDDRGALAAYQAYMRRCANHPDGMLIAAPEAFAAMDRLNAKINHIPMNGSRRRGTLAIRQTML